MRSLRSSASRSACCSFSSPSTCAPGRRPCGGATSASACPLTLAGAGDRARGRKRRRRAEPRAGAAAPQARRRPLRPRCTERLRLRPWSRHGPHRERLLMLALFGVSFLTPLDGLFVLLAALPLGALLLT